MNESTASIARNTRAMMVSQVITWASSFLLMSFMPRYLGDEEYGRLFFAISANAIAALLMDLGFTMLLVKEVARDRGRANSLLLNGGILRIIAWSISMALVMGYVLITGKPAETVTLVFVLALSNLFLGLYELIHRIFVGIERLEYRSISLIVEKVFLAVVAVGMLLLGYGTLEIACVMLAGTMLNFTVSVMFLRRAVKVDFRDVNTSTWPRLLADGTPFMVAFIFAFIYYRIDVMMLESMTGNAVVGWYGAPFRLFDTLMFFPVILNTAVYPVLARQFRQSDNSMRDTSRKILDLTFIVAMPVAVGMAALAEPIIHLLFGSQFSQSVIILQLFAFTLVLVYVDFVLNTVLIAADRQKMISWIAVAATVINVTINYGAITYFQDNFGNGAIGAALTKALTEVFVMAMYVALLPKRCFTAGNLWLGVKTFIGGGIMWGAIWLVELSSPGWFVSGAVGCVVYAAALFALKVLSKREVRFLLSLIPLRKSVATSVSNN